MKGRFSFPFVLAFVFVSHTASADFIKVNGTHFEKAGARYSYLGTNLWYAMNLGSTGTAGDRTRLTHELDTLQSLGVNNIRILGASEGPADQPWRIVPALQNSPGVYDQDLLQGLDFLLSEMAKRNMTAVVILGDFWQWSGGFAQYMSWATASAIPYPPPAANGDWNTFEDFSSQFYLNQQAVSLYLNTVKQLVTRTNSITGVAYSEDPTIMSWELGNEPRGIDHPDEFNSWIEMTSKYIKSLDSNHLVTTGCEGQLDGAGLDLLKNNSSPSIDYVTTHIWAQNFGWYDPTQPTKTFGPAVNEMEAFLANNLKLSEQIGKPLVLEEFGLARDDSSYDPESQTTYRDQYYDIVFNDVLTYARQGRGISGVNFWAWAGEARPELPVGGWWKPGDPFLGDPPHEPQGWYSIYDTDVSTLMKIVQYSSSISAVTSMPK
jgi:mannan endo-1,4-beta-mannosidase